jgi:putative RecB family exonuclease
MTVQATGTATTSTSAALPAGAPEPATGSAEETATAERPVRASLSPSRAADFKTCPLLYRFRSIDRLPEQPTADQARGTLVHAVLERLFDLAPAERTAEQAAELVEPQWRQLVDEHAELAEIFATEVGGADSAVSSQAEVSRADLGVPGQAEPAGAAAGARAVAMTAEEFLASARDLLNGYFAVEDPQRLSPAERECLVTTEIDEGRLLLRGYIDRLDISPTGDIRVVDYKTGGAPREAFEARALFQLKFYALVLWRTRGVVPRVLRLLYLKDAEICDYTPDTEELARFERTLIALWAAIEKAIEARDFRPKPSRLCGWCAHQSRCPAFGGTPPPFPETVGLPSAQPGRGHITPAGEADRIGIPAVDA